MLLLCALVVGSGYSIAATEDGTFIIDFYDSSKLSSTSGTGLTNSNYSSFVQVPTGATATGVVTSVSVTGTVRYGMNGGLTAGTGTAASADTHYVTFNIASGYAVKKCTVYATVYDNGRWLLNGNAASSGSLGTKGAAIENVTSPLVWTFAQGQTTLTFKKDNGSSGNQKRLTIYRIVCEYGSVKEPEITPSDGTTFTGSQSVTISQEDGKNIYYTTDGTNPTDASTHYTGPFNVSASAITGEVTVKAIAYDGTKKSTIVSATYTDTSIQPTLVGWAFNNTYLGVDDGKNLTGVFTKTIKGVKATINRANTSATYPRGDTADVRFYLNTFLKLEAPDGYNITKVEFTTAGSWTDPTPTVGSIDTKVWTGETDEVQFDFTATSYAGAIEITLTRDLPFVVSFGDLNKTTLVKDETDYFSTTVTPATGSLVDGTDYEVTWASSNDEGLTVASDGEFLANTRGAYKVTATATALDDTSYRNASKEYDVTVTEAVSVLADDVVMGFGDDPVAITVVKPDDYAGTLTYESDDEDVATVDASGNVTAVAKGTTTITISAPADEANYFTEGADVTINVTVKGTADLAYTTTLYNVAYGASFPTPALTNPHGLTVTYSKSGANVATVDAATGAVTILSGTKGTARITASTVGNDEYAPGSAYYDIKVYDPDGGDGTLAKPFSVEEANEWIAENLVYTSTSVTTSENYYVRGIVSSLAVNGKDLDHEQQYFFISEDGTETDELGVYKANYLNNDPFSTTTWVMPGDEVVVYGPLQNYDGDKPYYVETSAETYVVSVTRRSFADVSLPVEETFSTSFGSFTTDGTTVRKDVNSTTYNVWTIDTSRNYAKATSFVDYTNTDAESMLISGMLDGRSAIGLELSFSQCINKYFGNGTIADEAMVYAKEDGGDWVKQTISSYPSLGSNTWSSFEDATIDLSAFDGKKFQIAFVYRGTSTTAGTWEIKDVKIASASVNVTIGLNGFTTFASPYALDLTEANLQSQGVVAYKAVAKDGMDIVFRSIDQTVLANTGILLKGTAGTTVEIDVVASGDAVDGNIFEVNIAGTKFTPVSDYYYFGMKKATSPSDDLTFALFDPYQVAIPATKAYFKLLQSDFSGGVKTLNARFDDGESTGITEVQGVNGNAEGAYDLMGRKVAQPTRGLYIVNGKKVFINK